MINQCRAAVAAVGAFLRVKRAAAGSQAGTSQVRRHAVQVGVLALGAAPLAFAADLQLTNLSDTGYDPSPLGAEVVYSVTLENGAGDLSAPATSIFDLPAGATAGTLPGFCATDGTVSTRIVCSHGALQGTQAGGTALSFQIGVNTGSLAAGTVTMHGAVGFTAALPAAATPISSLVPGNAFFCQRHQHWQQRSQSEHHAGSRR